MPGPLASTEWSGGSWPEGARPRSCDSAPFEDEAAEG
eukprot:CAMPEP_0202872710 /NCGR_PEP_ID=MMETSP1391-20130828/21831_1 /ASSEMBLY_ACC=CAM_ASM_000867 /TAXON_ID=1034604 /ORGANISM="Chlamydomonas leiostraca, Strain SAG 11-49" /LENGTH=36 /DNA_ID= /DNA_START= /DNA_END= /DNA_ORIENTATION=